MASVRRAPGPFRAVIVDLDEVLLLREPAWRYALEEAVAAATGERVDAARISSEYRFRPWRQALAVVLRDAAAAPRVEALCQDMYERSAMKRLLVQDGVGMVLDRFRGEGVEVGAVSREPHHVARKQIESTGIDRFLAALSARGPKASDMLAAVYDCVAFMEHEARVCAFVGPDPEVLRLAEAAGLSVFEAAWEQPASGQFAALESPRALLRLLGPTG